jgi:hypothetical protein
MQAIGVPALLYAGSVGGPARTTNLLVHPRLSVCPLRAARTTNLLVHPRLYLSDAYVKPSTGLNTPSARLCEAFYRAKHTFRTLM